MEQLFVRDVDDGIVRALEARARRHGISAEEEHRRILRQALALSSRSFKPLLGAMPDVGDDADFACRRA
jgi:plasmid stability protein